MLYRSLLGLAAGLQVAVATNSTIDPAAFNKADIIDRDVAVIGGGSAGTYAAIRLRQLNQSVAVVEKKDRLGGHTETYVDAVTETAVDYGVLYYENTTVVTDYFAHFNIPLTTVFASGHYSNRVDFTTGKPAGAPQGNQSAALALYAAQLQKYPYLDAGFDLPDPVPEDLLLPFEDWVKKHNLGDAVNVITMYNQGVGNPLKQSTIYMLKYFGLEVLKGIKGGFLQTAAHDNSLLYLAAKSELGHDVYLQSTVKAVNRSNSRNPLNYVVINTPAGEKLIRAKRIIVAVPPKVSNLNSFDLDHTERSLFSQFRNSYYYSILAKNTGIPEGLTLTNRGNNTLYNTPRLPGIYTVRPTLVSGLVSILYGSEKPLTEQQVKDDITKSVLRLRNSGYNTTTPEYVQFSDHSPFELVVPANAIRDDFYKELYGLQGHRDTFYTGAAWHVQDSSLIWRFTESLLQKHFA
ncbi:hypothetical protein ASPWEDRAFT_158633 [Aspergillus wentii DTO 134E9]|uniref:Amine oxidase domain-containing protein n=1 Tax=Aspergillus wentii DTO 134E9 TaxID=1073089 RepID=A0A1L9RCF5_ASPWE|nr:uncharacterized protein ASPWEDRAFT_158633 [Aspergillus wentii DTO 134E9]KAI9924190.1 hypothetical protein MW887_007140 [Aspergillus wentii]OJJ32605.1 hypothetical protein ASPWEDRAFT_158633 [Aspergillus wentii DTO 134E9]